MKINKYFEKYINQPDKLPDWVNKNLEKNNDEVKLYALSDLNESFEFDNKWIVLGSKSIYIEEKGQKFKVIDYENYEEVSEVNGTSCHALSLLDKDKKILEVIYFSNRQRVIFAQVTYFLKEKIKNKNFDIYVCAEDQYQKALLQNLKKKQSGKETSKQKVVWRLLSYLLPYRKELIWGGFGAVLTTIVSLVPPYLSGYLIDNTIQPFQNGSLEMDSAIEMAWIILIGLSTTYILREIFVWLRLKKMSILGEKVARDLRRDLYNHLQRLEMEFFSSKQTGSIISRVSSDTDRVWDFVAFGVVEVAIALILLMGLGIILLLMDLRLGLIMTIPVPLLIFSIFLHGQKIQTLFLKAWRKWSDMTDVLSDTISGIQVVKAFNQEEKEKSRFSKKNENAYDVFIGIHHSWTKFWPGLMLAIKFIMLFVWFLAIPRLISPASSPDYLTAGTFVSFLLYMTMFVQPIEVIGQMARMLNRATSSAYRIFEILDTEPTLVNKENPEVLNNLKGDIQFKDVIFSYDGVRQIIKGMSFHIKEGEMIGLVGPSGGGKSTITKLISRFYDINSGSILIDGHELRELEVGSYRTKIGMVLQEPYLFHGTIAENISYGMDTIDRDKIILAANVANAHEFIMKFKDGYDTIVGERGKTLSGGERQRISIARAVLHDPKILILDEATSAVDTETERKIQDALDKLVKGRTVIAIAHRLSTLRKADRILVIKDGEVLESGTHSNLMTMDGEYKKLQDMQQEMYELMNDQEKKKEVLNEILS